MGQDNQIMAKVTSDRENNNSIDEKGKKIAKNLVKFLFSNDKKQELNDDITNCNVPDECNKNQLNDQDSVQHTCEDLITKSQKKQEPAHKCDENDQPILIYVMDCKYEFSFNETSSKNPVTETRRRDDPVRPPKPPMSPIPEIKIETNEHDTEILDIVEASPPTTNVTLRKRRCGTASLLAVPSTTNDIDPASKKQTESGTDLSQLKDLTARLNLKTRRTSYVVWKQEYLDKPLLARYQPKDIVPDDVWSTDRKEEINTAIGWLRRELMEMKSHDEELARRLITIKHEIRQLKQQRTFDEHREMLEDVQFEFEEREEMSDVMCDLPMEPMSPAPLKHMGVTKMNISSRRFSVL